MWSSGDDTKDQPGVQEARRLGASGVWPEAVTELEALLHADGWVVHAEAAEALGLLAARTGHRDDEDVFQLIAMVASGATSYRLRRDHTPESFRKLCAGGARGLGHLGTERAREVLRRGIGHPECEVRAALCEGFGALGDAEGERTLLALLTDDPHHYVRIHAAVALRGYGKAARAAIRAQASREGEWFVRCLLLEEARLGSVPPPRPDPG